MVKREFLLKASLLFSLLLIFSACQSKKADTKQSIKESTVMTTDKSSAKQSTESNVKNSTESSNQTFPTGSLIQAVSDNDSAKVQEILKDKNYTINEVNAQGESPF